MRYLLKLTSFFLLLSCSSVLCLANPILDIERQFGYYRNLRNGIFNKITSKLVDDKPITEKTSDLFRPAFDMLNLLSAKGLILKNQKSSSDSVKKSIEPQLKLIKAEKKQLKAFSSNAALMFSLHNKTAKDLKTVKETISAIVAKKKDHHETIEEVRDLLKRAKGVDKYVDMAADILCNIRGVKHLGYITSKSVHKSQERLTALEARIKIDELKRDIYAAKTVLVAQAAHREYRTLRGIEDKWETALLKQFNTYLKCYISFEYEIRNFENFIFDNCPELHKWHKRKSFKSELAALERVWTELEEASKE